MEINEDDKPIPFCGKLLLLIGLSAIGIPLFAKIVMIMVSFWSAVFSKIN